MITQTQPITNSSYNSNFSSNSFLNYEQIRSSFVDMTVNNCHDRLKNNFNKREHALIQQLQHKATQLKQNIAELKKKTSQQQISLRISKRRQQKEAQRALLQKSWRDLTQKLKKLEAEEKKLENQNNQSKFDITNLEEKIQELKTQNCKLNEYIASLKNKTSYTHNLSQDQHKSYISPYRLTIASNLNNTIPKFTKFIQNTNHNQYNLSQTNKFQTYNMKFQNQIIHRKNKSIDKKLMQIKVIKQFSPNLILQLLGKKSLKAYIYQILRN